MVPAGGATGEGEVDGPVDVLERLRTPGLVRRLFHELVRFGSVGAIGFVIDVGLFNLLSYGPWAPLAGQPLAAKVCSVSVSTLFAWLGNRHWTFKHRRGRAAHKELVLFVLFSGGGLLIALACLWISHYVLGLRSPLADNISANVIGLGLGSAFRFITYRTFVFHRAGHVAAGTSAHV